MAKKEAVVLTPEELQAQKERKIEKRKIFGDTFVKAIAMLLSILLVYSIVYIAFGQGTTIVKQVNGAASSNTSSNNTSSNNTSSNNTSSSDSSTASSSSDTAADNGGAASGDAATVVSALNAATSKAVNEKAGYTLARNCSYTKNIDVGSATDSLNSIIHRIDENADLNSVVGGFIGLGEKSGTLEKGASNIEDVSDNYLLKATTLKDSDLKNLQVNGNTYTFALENAGNPQKDNSTSLSRFTNDFITQQEVSDGIAGALGGLSFLVSVKSSDVQFTNIKVKATVEDGKLTSLEYEYDMEVAKLELSVATGTGSAHTKTTYSNFVY